MTGQLGLCGLDEAGRGALAGPLVVAAVVLAIGFAFEDIAPEVIVRDSKKLTTKQREIVFKVIENNSLQIETETISVEEINGKGINWANIEGFRRLIAKMSAREYIVDGRWRLPDMGIKTPLVHCIIHADENIPAVLAAGIVAKMKRDEIMRALHLSYPMYRWYTNTGHGTAQHLAAIKRYGLCKHHRIQFVATALRNSADHIDQGVPSNPREWRPR